MPAQQHVLPLPGLEVTVPPLQRGDHLLMAEMVTRGSKVLDVGCGEGDLLQLLESRGIDGRGIELSREGVNRCVAKGLAVVQGDADTDLVNYPDDSFDYVILSQTLQATRQPKVVLENLLRIGRRAIVSFPNFGFWRMRLQLLVGGQMPRTENLPATWYDTPNIHFCTIKDFVQLCDEINVKMERAVALDLNGRPLRLNAPWWFWNMFGEQGVFLLSRHGTTNVLRTAGKGAAAFVFAVDVAKGYVPVLVAILALRNGWVPEIATSARSVAPVRSSDPRARRSQQVRLPQLARRQERSDGIRRDDGDEYASRALRFRRLPRDRLVVQIRVSSVDRCSELRGNSRVSVRSDGNSSLSALPLWRRLRHHQAQGQHQAADGRHGIKIRANGRSERRTRNLKLTAR